MQVDCNAHNNKPRGFIPDSEGLSPTVSEFSRVAANQANLVSFWRAVSFFGRDSLSANKRGLVSHQEAAMKLPLKNCLKNYCR